MPISRRSILRTASIAAPALSALRAGRESLAQGATSVATPASGQMSSRALLDALLATPVTTRLFPSDTPEMNVVEWIDESDTDLDGATGGVILQTGEDDNGNVMGPGVYIVHESPEMARAVFDIQLANDPGIATESILGFPGVITRIPGQVNPPGADVTSEEFPGSSLITIFAGPVIVSAIGDGGEPDANDVRALANLAGMLDHLRLVQAPGAA